MPRGFPHEALVESLQVWLPANSHAETKIVSNARKLSFESHSSKHLLQPLGLDTPSSTLLRIRPSAMRR